MVAYLFLFEVILAFAKFIIMALLPIIEILITLFLSVTLQVVWTIYIKFVFQPFIETTYAAFLEHGLDAVMSFGFVDTMYSKMRVIGMAVFILIVAFQVFKVMFSYMGIEADDPLQIGMKAIFYGFLLYYSKDICAIMLSIFSSAMKYLLGGNSISQTASQISDMFLETQIISIAGLCYLYLSFKMIMVTFRFAQRYAVMLFLVIMSPLAFACGPSKATHKALAGWFKVFSGNLAVQLCQVIVILSVCKFYSDVEDRNIWKRLMPTSNLDTGVMQAVLSAIFMIGMITLLEQLERIVGEAQVGTAGGGGALSNPVAQGMSTFVDHNPIMSISDTLFASSKGLNAIPTLYDNIKSGKLTGKEGK